MPAGDAIGNARLSMTRSGSSDDPGVTHTYPTRKPFFASRFVRLTVKCGLALELGSDACMLLHAVASVEDELRYSCPVRYPAESLATHAGIKSKKTFLAVRKRLVEAGWLVYIPGTRLTAASYWVSVPESHRDLLGAPIGDGFRPANEPSGDADEVSDLHLVDPLDGDEVPDEVSPGDLERDLYNPTPIPNSKFPSSAPKRGAASEGDDAAPPAMSEVVEAWNEAKVFRRVVVLSAGRRRKLAARLRDPFWRDHWRDALARLIESPFCRGENDRGWVADFEFFIKPDTVAKALEGVYDAKPRGHPSNGPAAIAGRVVVEEPLPVEDDAEVHRQWLKEREAKGLPTDVSDEARHRFGNGKAARIPAPRVIERLDA